MIHVIAINTLKPGTRARVLERFAANVPTVLAEDGCIEYAPVVDADIPGLPTFGPDAFVVVEKWASAEALAAHAASPHMAAYVAAVAPFVISCAVHALVAAA